MQYSFDQGLLWQCNLRMVEIIGQHQSYLRDNWKSKHSRTNNFIDQSSTSIYTHFRFTWWVFFERNRYKFDLSSSSLKFLTYTVQDSWREAMQFVSRQACDTSMTWHDEWCKTVPCWLLRTMSSGCFSWCALLMPWKFRVAETKSEVRNNPSQIVPTSWPLTASRNCQCLKMN